ncbi:MAG: hypothetical protein ABMA01_22405 [Chthoniobacteraceae bacterium]
MNSTEAEENLRVIRSLMEKATIYRAISAPTALAGGVASALFGSWLYFHWRPLPQGIESAQFGALFLSGWLAVLALTGVTNTYLLWSDARRRGDRFISVGMKHALLAMLPAMLCGAGLTGFFLWANRPFWLPPVWMLCYALGLLATKGFAPRSIHFLGWAFFASGFAALGALAVIDVWDVLGDGEAHVPTAANLLMVATFGVFHLIYAACTWARGTGRTN